MDSSFPYDPIFLKTFFQVCKFDPHFKYQYKALESVIFDYSIYDVCNYQRTISAYQLYMKKNNIDKDNSEEDPLNRMF